MEKIFKCVKCKKDFRVMNEVQDPENLPKVKLSVECPFCETKNVIDWRGNSYLVAPK